MFTEDRYTSSDWSYPFESHFTPILGLMLTDSSLTLDLCLFSIPNRCFFFFSCPLSLSKFPFIHQLVRINYVSNFNIRFTLYDFYFPTNYLVPEIPQCYPILSDYTSKWIWEYHNWSPVCGEDPVYSYYYIYWFLLRIFERIIQVKWAILPSEDDSVVSTVRLINCSPLLDFIRNSCLLQPGGPDDLTKFSDGWTQLDTTMVGYHIWVIVRRRVL